MSMALACLPDLPSMILSAMHSGVRRSNALAAAAACGELSSCSSSQDWRVLRRMSKGSTKAATVAKMASSSPLADCRKACRRGRETWASSTSTMAPGSSEATHIGGSCGCGGAVSSLGRKLPLASFYLSIYAPTYFVPTYLSIYPSIYRFIYLSYLFTI